MATAFIAPRRNDKIFKAVRLIAPLYMRSSCGLKVHLDQSVGEAFAKTHGAAAIVCPNHSAADDALVAFAISREINEKFYFMTTREIFRWHPTLRSLWLQSLGCYSILRAGPDIESFKTSCQLLSGGDHKLVIFPEGEISHQNGALLPLEMGPVLLALKVASQKARKGKGEPIFVVPVGITYRFDGDSSEELKYLLGQIEEQLGIETTRAEVGLRIRACFNTLLTVQETTHRLKQNQRLSIEARIDRFGQHLARELSISLSVDFPETTDLIDKLHLLKNKLTQRRYCNKIEPSEDTQATYKLIVATLGMLAITEDSFRETMSQEAVAELLEVLNMHVMKQRFVAAPRTAFVAAARPFDVQPHLKTFESEKLRAVRIVTAALADAMRTEITGLLQKYPTKAQMTF